MRIYTKYSRSVPGKSDFSYPVFCRQASKVSNSGTLCFLECVLFCKWAPTVHCSSWFLAMGMSLECVLVSIFIFANISEVQAQFLELPFYLFPVLTTSCSFKRSLTLFVCFIPFSLSIAN